MTAETFHLIPAITGAVSGAASVGLLNGPLQTLQDIWFVVYGHKWHYKVESIKAQQAMNIQAMQNNIQTGIEKIPANALKDPNVAIIGPALEASRFHMNEENIREMFANLIVSAMDERKDGQVHHAFVEIIKSLSPLDAKNLEYLSQSGDAPIVNIVKEASYGFHMLHQHVFLGNPEVSDQDLIAPSIDNLSRLKLIDITYNDYLTDDSEYESFYHSAPYQEMTSALDKEHEALNLDISILQNPDLKIEFEGKILNKDERSEKLDQVIKGLESKIEIQKGVIKLTAFGKNFLSVCSPTT
ncbi:hypothetical protein BAE51_02905 [Moraxella catarrhalis]|uniref:DUF4393 domain-containing protein n=1 Tax=Moraxella catarrhalis TaxID=480 RepID=UPI000802FA77|nr:DUF4393 domain-containing protein [Moraxella catarrhalis]OBX77681.1 hypothetical protein BAE51_02905 [Moraxella catarrhalis]